MFDFLLKDRLQKTLQRASRYYSAKRDPLATDHVGLKKMVPYCLKGVINYLRTEYHHTGLVV